MRSVSILFVFSLTLARIGLVTGQESRPVAIETPTLTEFFPNAGIPAGITVDRRGHVWFTGKGALHEADAVGNLIRTVETGGNPAGTALLPNGNLLVTDDGQRAVLEVRADGFYRVVARDCAGQPFIKPNSLCVHRDGRAYFLDLADSSTERASGRVHLLQPGGRVMLVAEGLRLPSGIALGSDGKSLYVGENGSGAIWRYPLKADGSAGERVEFARLEPETPTGFALDEVGNLWIGLFGKGVVAAVNREGKVARQIAIGGKRPSSVAFMGTALLVGEGEQKRVAKIELGVRGARLPPG